MQYISFLVALVLLMFAGWYGFQRDADLTVPELPTPVVREVFEDQQNENEITNTFGALDEEVDSSNNVAHEAEINVDEEVQVPDTVAEHKKLEAINLAIPFTSQAPHANWDLPYQEACEEASVLMAHWYLEGSDVKSKDEADKEILDLVAWQEAHFGFYKDTTVDQTLEILHKKFGYAGSAVHPASIEIIEQSLLAGNPVIIPASGKQLKNPYFSGEGPLYHMLVIRGFTENDFITNDPGTRRGKEFLYEKNHLLSTIHDWNDGDVENGEKLLIIVKK